MRQKLSMQRGELERGIAVKVAKQSIASRIRRVCANFDETEFSKLVDRMAEIQVRYQLRDEWAPDVVYVRHHLN